MTKTNIIGIIVGIAGVAYAYYSNVKIREVAEKLDLTLDDLANKADVKVEDSMLKAAAEMAVEKEVGRLARMAAMNACSKVSEDMQDRVKDAVNAEYENISKSVLEEVTLRVSRIDEDDLKKRITKGAEDKIVTKFEGSLDGLLNNCSEKVGTIMKVYDSIEGHIRDRDKSSSRYHISI